MRQESARGKISALIADPGYLLHIMKRSLACLTGVLAWLLCGPVLAQEHGPRNPHGPRELSGRMVFDNRYHHDHYYPAPGFVAPALPHGSVNVGYGREHFFFHGGIWYRPYGPSYRVIVPPVGIVIPILPSAYVTLRFGGVPYYYANGVYYTAVVGGPGYVVATPPPNVEPAPVIAAAPPPPKPDPIIYPRNGQSNAQLESDRQDCNRWATTQPAAMNDTSVFNRAVEACMDGRGYTMR